jgi:predicted DNA-binding antitoxin AbrB/MazE fold protein
VQTPEQQPKPLMTVTLKEGESLDLKEVKVEILPPDKKILEHAGEVEEVEEETPIAPDFRP